MTFDARAQPSFTFEIQLLEELAHRGWTACRYGQGMLTEPVRQKLKNIQTPLRWHPDILAIREWACFVDAKTGRLDTPNHSIEQSSLAAFYDWYHHARIPHLVVWHTDTDSVGDCAFIWELLADGAPLRAMTHTGAGSGTPGWLWPKAACHPFEEVFDPGAPEIGIPPEWRMAQIRNYRA